MYESEAGRGEAVAPGERGKRSKRADADGPQYGGGNGRHRQDHQDVVLEDVLHRHGQPQTGHHKKDRHTATDRTPQKGQTHRRTGKKRERKTHRRTGERERESERCEMTRCKVCDLP
jgi:hypothetical protein